MTNASLVNKLPRSKGKKVIDDLLPLAAPLAKAIFFSKLPSTNVTFCHAALTDK